MPTIIGLLGSRITCSNIESADCIISSAVKMRAAENKHTPTCFPMLRLYYLCLG